MNILQEIFLDNYEEFMMTTHPRASVVENVDKMIECGNPSFGGAMYGCTKCGTLKFVPFRCHSRFCPTCGVHYSAKRTSAMSFKLIKVPHRHCVFTIPDELRHFFIEDRNLLNCLFNAVRSVILEMFYKDNKTECFTPGMICVLHTFGRSLQWNPHIHCLVTEGGIGNKTVWRPKKHFKQIRYYGVYARNRIQDQKVFKAISKEKHKFLLNCTKWRNSISSAFGYDPIQCPCCKQTMTILEIKYAHHSYTLQELYDRAWAKAG